METDGKFETWAVVEIFGHQKFAGFVTEQAIGGASLVRVDVPECPPEKNGEPSPAFTKLFGPAAIYSITPVSEAVARVAAARIRATPVNVWMPELHPVAEPSTPSLGSGELGFEGDGPDDDEPGSKWDDE